MRFLVWSISPERKERRKERRGEERRGEQRSGKERRGRKTTKVAIISINLYKMSVNLCKY